MEEETLERAILEYLSSDDDTITVFRSLSTIFEDFAEPYTENTKYFLDGGEVSKREYIRAFLDQMEGDGLLEARMDEHGNEKLYRVTEQGVYERSFEDLSLVLEPVERRGDGLIVVDSADWTGLPRAGVLSESAANRLKAAVKLLDHAVEESSASNEERAQARAYILALSALADAPEPPAELIWKIITLAAALSGIGQLFVAILDLYT